MKLYIVLLSTLFISGCFTSGTGIPIVGIDKDGNEVVEYISERKLQDKVQYLLEDISQTTLKTVDRMKYKSDWELSTVTVGIGLNTKFKIKHVTSLGSTGRLRLSFSKQPNPVIPD